VPAKAAAACKAAWGGKGNTLQCSAAGEDAALKSCLLENCSPPTPWLPAQLEWIRSFEPMFSLRFLCLTANGISTKTNNSHLWMQMELLPRHAQLISKLATALQRGMLTQVEEEAVCAIAYNSMCSRSNSYHYGPALMQQFTAASLATSAGSALRTLRGYHGRGSSSNTSTTTTTTATNPSMHPNLRCVPARTTLRSAVQDTADSLCVQKESGLSNTAMHRSLELLMETTAPLLDPLLAPKGCHQLVTALNRQAQAQPLPPEGEEGGCVHLLYCGPS